MSNGLNYVLGLDIGIGSVAAAILLVNSNDEPIMIVGRYVIVFDSVETKDGKSKAVPRRIARSSRRRLRRKKLRMDDIKKLFQKNGLIEIESFMKRYKEGNLPDVYELRYEGLNRLLTDEEFAQVLLYIAKHRGFRSTRKSERTDKDAGKMITATEANKKLLEEKGYRTVGEMIYLDDFFHEPCNTNEKGYVIAARNHKKDYKHTILRAMLVDEVHALFAAQRLFGNKDATESLENDFIAIMTRQRSFDVGPGLQADGTPSPFALNGFKSQAGKCTFEDGETRAAKGTFTAELFIALQKLNNTQLLWKTGEHRHFTEDELAVLIEMLLSQKEIKYSSVRSKFKLGDDVRFSGLKYRPKKQKAKKSDKDADKSETKTDTKKKTKDEPEKVYTYEEITKQAEDSKFVGMTYSYTYNKILNDRVAEMDESEKAELFDNIGEILTSYKTDDARTERLSKLGLNADEIDDLLSENPKEYVRLSKKALLKVNPYLRQGMTYDKACEAAGYDFHAKYNGVKMKFLRGDVINDEIKAISSPVVRRSVSQTLKLINAVIRKYGSPQSVHIELARDISKTREERLKLEAIMTERRKSNEQVRNEIVSNGHLNPSGNDIVMYRLWKEQNGICLYSGNPIPKNEIFSGKYEIDHIIPYSISFDDGFQNKALVFRKENQDKGNRIPYEYFGYDKKRWAEYTERVESLIGNSNKKNRLLRTSFTEDDKKEFKERNLNDTRYATKVVKNIIEDYLYMEDYNRSGHKKKVYAVNGNITAYLRKRWGLPPKDRENDRHHAMDAVIIACCTDGMIAKITKAVKERETAYMKDFKEVDEETGEILTRANFTRDQWDEVHGAQIPLPWAAFRDEMNVSFMDGDPKEFLEKHRDVAMRIGYPDWMYGDEESPFEPGQYINYLTPLFVRREKNHKATGSAHSDTIRSKREYETRQVVISKRDLRKLKLKNGEIPDYYNKESDPLLYNALVKRLQEFGGDGKKAFAEPFHKPKKDGTEGPIVRSIKVEEKKASGVEIRGGLADNGDMVKTRIYYKDGKYRFVPIYVADTIKDEMPMKAASKEPYAKWKEMDEDDFLFEIQKGDLIHIKKAKGSDPIDMYAYYTSANTSTNSFSLVAHDHSETYCIGITTLDLIEKCYVDKLGQISMCR